MAKFYRRGLSKIYWVVTVAGGLTTGNVTTAELAAGVDLSASIAEISGFQANNSPIPTPNLAESFTSQIEGEDTTSDSTLTFWDDAASTTIRTALVKGTQGFVVLLPYGSAATKRSETWSAKTLGVNDVWTVANEGAQFVVGFAILAAPKQIGAVS